MRATRAINTPYVPSSFIARLRARIAHIRGWHSRFEAAVEAADPSEIIAAFDLFFAALAVVAFAALLVMVASGLDRYFASR